MIYIVDYTDSEGKRRTEQIRSNYPLTKEKDAPIIAFQVRSQLGHELATLHEIKETTK